MCDLMWSDPDDVKSWSYSPRGAGWLFGAEVVDKFLKDNKIDLIVRAHQLVNEGYRTQFNDTLITVWSAPNYCYRCGNVAAIMELDENLSKMYKIFEAAPVEEKEKDRKFPFAQYIS